jgi:hypothetical protein
MNDSEARKGMHSEDLTWEDTAWCYWCDRPCADCACESDPNGVPQSHWSKGETK